MITKPILIIHPNDKTTEFLNRIKNPLIEKFKDRIHHFNIYPNLTSHKDCLERIYLHPDKGLIIFLGHGRSDKLYGSRGPLYGSFENELVKIETPEKYYYNEDFINEANVEVLAGKKVFCLSCNSNDKISDFAINKGTRVFLGFGDIFTSTEEFRDDGIKNVSNDLVISMKTNLNYVIKTSLIYGIENNYSFERLRDLIHFIINQRISDTITHKGGFKDKMVFVDYLYYFKKNIKIKGNKNLLLIE